MGPSMSVCRVFPTGVSNLHGQGALLCNNWNLFCYPIVVIYVVCHSCCYCYSMALPPPSPGRTPLCLCHLRLDHPGLRRTGTAHEGLRTHGTRSLPGTVPLGTPPGNAPTPSPSQDFLFNPWGFTTRAHPQDACFVGAWFPAIIAPKVLRRCPPLPCLGHQAWRPLCFNHPGCNISARMT
jgi:hypothetical protein